MFGSAPGFGLIASSISDFNPPSLFIGNMLSTAGFCFRIMAFSGRPTLIPTDVADFSLIGILHRIDRNSQGFFGFWSRNGVSG